MATRRARDLTIRQIFSLLAILNGIVLISLLLSAWQLLTDRGLVEQHAYTTLFLGGLLVLGVATSYRIVSLRVVEPLARLARQSERIAADDQRSDDLLVVHGSDEIARLTEAFNAVLLSQRRAIAQVEDSIRYAALLQKSILPDRQLQERFGTEHFVLWQPRDTVGGDYYVFHDDGARCLAGVADCAGHGVPGAMMTMLARAGIDRSIQQVGIASPAAVLQATHAGMNLVLSEAQISRALATTMDVGLVFLDFKERIMRFAGAKISLYWSDGQRVEQAQGDGRSLWDRRSGQYQDHQVPLLKGFTYYLATDGVFDQSGGDLGFGFGTDRFRSWLLAHATLPLSVQHQAFGRALREFMGSHPQRDDITMLSFRIG
jgi:serine phosphatase RsbU (regulator of sigma subunit)